MATHPLSWLLHGVCDCMLGLRRRCYNFDVVNETIVAPSAPCCHGNEPSWYVGTWFINFEVFSAVGILAFGE